MNNNTIASAPVSEWQQLATLPTPGTKCLMLTLNGLCVVGFAPRDVVGYLAWAPLPKRPEWLRP